MDVIDITLLITETPIREKKKQKPKPKPTKQKNTVVMKKNLTYNIRTYDLKFGQNC